MFCSFVQSQDLDNHRRSAACYHQHGAAVAYSFVIQVDAHDGVAAQGCSTVGHLSEGCILSLAECAFVRTASAADYITDTGKESFTKLVPMMVSPVTTPRYSRIGWPSMVGVVLKIIIFSFLFYVIINVIYSLDDKSREKVAENPKIIVTFASEI